MFVVFAGSNADAPVLVSEGALNSSCHSRRTFATSILRHLRHFWGEKRIAGSIARPSANARECWQDRGDDGASMTKRTGLNLSGTSRSAVERGFLRQLALLALRSERVICLGPRALVKSLPCRGACSKYSATKVLKRMDDIEESFRRIRRRIKEE
jgi:hypothetical protein